MKNALYVLQHAKRHLLGWSKAKIKPTALASYACPKASVIQLLSIMQQVNPLNIFLVSFWKYFRQFKAWSNIIR